MTILDKNIHEVFKKAILLGVDFNIEGELLHFKAPNGLPEELRNIIKTYRAEFIDLVRQENALNVPEKNYITTSYDAIYQQTELFLLQEMEKNISAYNIPRIFKIQEDVSHKDLFDALQALVDNHDILRTSFFSEGGVVKCRLNQNVKADFSACKLQSQEELHETIEKIIHKPFFLNVAPLMSLSIIEYNNEVFLIFVIHHIIADEFTVNGLLDDFSHYYSTKNYELQKKSSLCMADYAIWKNKWLGTIRAEISREYWLNKFSALESPIELMASAKSGISKYAGDMMQFILRSDQAREVIDFSQKNAISEYSLLLTAYSILIHTFFNHDEVILSSSYSNRDEKEFSETYGYLGNPVLFKNNLDYKKSAIELIRDIQTQSIELHEQKRIPFGQVLAMFDKNTAVKMCNFMFDYVVTENEEGLKLNDKIAQPINFKFKWAKFPLTLFIKKKNNDFYCIFEWQEQFFDMSQIQNYCLHFELILNQLLDKKSINEMEFRSQAEIDLMKKWNDTDFPLHINSLIDIFDNQAKKNSEKIALVKNSQALSYGELLNRSNQLAGYLKQLGVKNGDIVGVCMERSCEMFYAILAILKLGAAYLPLDTAYPQDRLLYMVKDASVKLIFLDQTTQHVIFSGVKCFDMESFCAEIPNEIFPNVNESNSEDTAYIIYTSGSTGVPKGVVVKQHNVLNYITWISNKLGVSPQDIFDFSTSLSFDLSVTCTLLPLLKGCTIAIADDETKKDPPLYLNHLEKSRISFIKTTPSYFSQMLNFSQKTDLPELKLIIIGGESLSASVVESWINHHSQHKLVNEYGPTEATVAVSAFMIEKNNLVEKIKGTFPIGFPAYNTKLYVLNAHGKVCPVGAIGEVFISGDSVASGYLNRPEVSQEKFLDDPLWIGKKMYRTGDLASWSLKSGLIYHGRSDEQIKVRGYRVELGEILSALLSIVEIRNAVVINKTVDGNTKLIAYYVSDGILNENSIKDLLAQRLPEFMLPHYFVPIASVPLTPNNKIDMKALPNPLQELISTSNVLSLDNNIETKLIKIWRTVLKNENVGINDDFFQLGGDSISCLMVLAKAHDEGINFAVKDLFEARTIKYLLPRVTCVLSDISEQGCLTGELSLLPIQKWFFSQNFYDLNYWNQIIELSLPDDLDISILEKVFLQIYHYHDALRVNFLENDGDWQAFYQDTKANPGVFEVVIIKAVETETQIKQTLLNIQKSFNISAGILFKAVLFKTENNQTNLFIISHHLSVDAVSWRILVDDLNRLYSAYTQGKLDFSLPKKTSSVREWAKYLNSQEYIQSALKKEGYFWTNQLQRSLGKLTTNEIGHNLESSSKEIVIELKTDTSKVLFDICSRLSISPNDVLMLALLRSLKDREGSNRWLLNLEHHGRSHEVKEFDFSRTIGWFTSVYPVAFELPVDSSPIDQLKSICQIAKSVPNNGINYNLLKESINSNGQPEICFNYLGRFNSNDDNKQLFNIKRMATGYERAANNQRPHILDINSLIHNDVLKIHWIYASELLTEQYMEKLMTAFSYHLGLIIDNIELVDIPIKVPADFLGVSITQKDIDSLLHRYKSEFLLAPATPVQQGFIYHHLKSKVKGDYLTQLTWSVEGALDVDRYIAAWEFVYKKYTMLRTGFLLKKIDSPLQIAINKISLPIRLFDWSNLDQSERDEKLRQLLASDRQEGFDITNPPLSRVYLLKENHARYKTLWSFDHTVVDGWSLSLMLSQLFLYYEGLVDDKSALPETDFFEYARWLAAQGPIGDEAKKFWQNYLGDFQKFTSFPMLSKVFQDGGFSKLYHLFSKDITDMIKIFVKANSLTLNTLIQGVWAILLSYYSKSNDVIFGVTVSGRNSKFPNIQKIAGMFINTLPLRIILEPQQTIIEWLRALQNNMRLVAEFEHLSVTEISELVNKNVAQYIQTNTVFENYPVEDKILANQSGLEEVGGLKISPPEPFSQSGYPISLVIIPNELLGLEILYNATNYNAQYIETLKNNFVSVLLCCIKNFDQPLDVLKTAIEINQKNMPLEEAYAFEQCIYTEKFYRRETIAERLLESFEIYGQKDALINDDRVITYQDLGKQSMRVAAALQSYGISTGDFVAVCLERSQERVMILCGIMLAGAAYIPIQPDTPPIRTLAIISDARPKMLIIDSLSFSDQKLNNIHVCKKEELLNFTKVEFQLQKYSENDPAYVIYTSGSTGKPKGVLIEHRGIINRLEWMQDMYKLKDEDRVIQKTPYSFDVSVWEFFWPLLVGMPLVIPKENGHKDPKYLLEQIKRHCVTTIHFVPSMLTAFLNVVDITECKSLRQIICSGEELQRSDVNFILEHSDIKVHNLYGPTEASIDVTYHECVIDQQNRGVPIGQPIANIRTYILDENLCPVFSGDPGELYLSGVGLAREYLNLEILTKEKFIKNPFSTEDLHDRLYKTGDLVKLGEDGNIYYLGRLDSQIKLRGFRIETAEIESILSLHENINKAVVLLQKNANGDSYLVAYIESGGVESDITHIKTFLQSYLPEYMIPSKIVYIKKIPITESGKTDRKSLKEYSSLINFDVVQEMIQPISEIEQLVYKIWCKVFDNTNISIHQNFFEIGGHSLRAIQIVSQVSNQLNIEVPLQFLFEYPTIYNFAKALESLKILEEEASVSSDGVEL